MSAGVENRTKANTNCAISMMPKKTPPRTATLAEVRFSGKRTPRQVADGKNNEIPPQMANNDSCPTVLQNTYNAYAISALMANAIMVGIILTLISYGF